MATSLFKWFNVLAGAMGTRVRMVATLFILFIVGWLGFAAAPVHPLYITVTEINHNVKDKTLEIAVKVFTSDLETALEKMSHGKVDLGDGSAAGKANGDRLIAEYVGKHLLLRVDGKAVSFSFVGREKESDGTWCYFQAADVAGVKKMEINNTMLYDSFEQEINIMHVTVGGVKKSTRLNYPDAKALLEF